MGTDWDRIGCVTDMLDPHVFINSFLFENSRVPCVIDPSLDNCPLLGQLRDVLCTAEYHSRTVTLKDSVLQDNNQAICPSPQQ